MFSLLFGKFFSPTPKPVVTEEMITAALAQLFTQQSSTTYTYTVKATYANWRIKMKNALNAAMDNII